MHPRFSKDEIAKIRTKFYGTIPTDQLDNLIGESGGILYAFMRKEVITDKDGEKEFNKLVEDIKEADDWIRFYERNFDKVAEELRKKFTKK